MQLFTFLNQIFTLFHKMFLQELLYDSTRTE